MNNLINNGQQAFNNFELFFDELLQESELVIDLILTASECNGAPIIEVSIDGDKIKSQILPEGNHELQIKYPIVNNKKSIHIEISMTGKLPKDTTVLNGQIVKDKYIIIEKIIINNFDITNDYEFFYNNLKYTNIFGEEESVKSGFWQNSTLHIEYDLPFIIWYQNNSKKNIELPEQIVYRDNKELVAQQYEKLVSKLHLLK